MKCGGTSIVSILEKWFCMIYDYHLVVDVPDEYYKRRVCVENLTSDHCIVGHYHQDGMFVFQRYPEIITRQKEIKCFTFIRNPLNFFLSFYYYSREVGRMDKSLQEFINSNKNLMAYYLGCEEGNYKEVLDKYFFIGITEEIQNSMDILAGLIDKPKITVPFKNKSLKDDQVSLLIPEFIEKFRNENELDYNIYEYSKMKFSNAHSALDRVVS